MVETEKFGRTREGREVTLYRLTNRVGAYVEVLDFGGRIRALAVPDRNGDLADVVLGYDSLAEYESDQAYHGALIGRLAGRVRESAFELNGRSFRLSPNDGPHHLHGGPAGFHNRLWTEQNSAPGALTLSLRSEDGEGGYPGGLSLRATYFFDHFNRLTLDIEARAEAETPLSLTSHPYFNLEGQKGGDILGHWLTIPADEFLEIDRDLLPNGRRLMTKGTPLDFTAPKTIGRDIEAECPQMKEGRGYDHFFLLPPGEGLSRAAEAWSEASGIHLTMTTNQPGLQFYSGNLLCGRFGKGGRPLGRHRGFCLEPQLWPGLNIPSFPAPILQPGRVFNHITCYLFSIRVHS